MMRAIVISVSVWLVLGVSAPDVARGAPAAVVSRIPGFDLDELKIRARYRRGVLRLVVPYRCIGRYGRDGAGEPAPPVRLPRPDPRRPDPSGRGPVRLRKHFPEAPAVRPALITDRTGPAVLSVR